MQTFLLHVSVIKQPISLFQYVQPRSAVSPGRRALASRPARRWPRCGARCGGGGGSPRCQVRQTARAAGQPRRSFPAPPSGSRGPLAPSPAERSGAARRGAGR